MDLLINWFAPFLVAVAMMGLDILTGFAAAAKNHVIMSGKMREGLWHKAGFFGLIVLGVVVEVATIWAGIHVDELGVAIPRIPSVIAICGLIVATEIISVMENLQKLNPQIMTLPISQILKAPEAANQDNEKVNGKHADASRN